MQRCRFWPAVDYLDADQDVFLGSFSVLHKDIEIAIFSKNSSVKEFKLERATAAVTVFLNQLAVGKFGLGIFVQELHVGVRRRGVEIEVIFFDVLSMVPLIAGQTKEALFKNRIATI